MFGTYGLRHSTRKRTDVVIEKAVREPYHMVAAQAPGRRGAPKMMEPTRFSRERLEGAGRRERASVPNPPRLSAPAASREPSEWAWTATSWSARWSWALTRPACLEHQAGLSFNRDILLTGLGWSHFPRAVLFPS